VTDIRAFAVVRSHGGKITVFRTDCGLLTGDYPEIAVLEHADSFAEAMAAAERHVAPGKAPDTCGWCRPQD
jgi:hypothetical protein